MMSLIKVLAVFAFIANIFLIYSSITVYFQKKEKKKSKKHNSFDDDV
jgi:hypothetical protein